MMAVLEKMYDSEGKFLRWESVEHNVKVIHDGAQYLIDECRTLFDQWELMGTENIFWKKPTRNLTIKLMTKDYLLYFHSKWMAIRMIRVMGMKLATSLNHPHEIMLSHFHREFRHSRQM